MSGTRGIFKVRNVSGASLGIEELAGHTLNNSEELDLLDDTLPVFYEDYASIKSASGMTTTNLYVQLQAGDLVVVDDVPPESLFPVVE